jgi:thiol:disulfide interchange protein DsbD
VIEATFYAPDIATLDHKDIYFCPEIPGLVDESIDAVLRPSKETPDQYTLTLKGSEAKGGPLKGTFVVGGHSFSLDTVVQGDDLEVAAADISKPGIIQQAIPDPLPEEDIGFVWALILAFAGGMILNLMPCVLPVVSFKVLSFVKMAGQSRITTLKHGLAFFWGIMISFWVLAGLLLILQAYGKSVGWGFQLQEPIFVSVLAALLFVFGLSLFGVFELGASLASWAGQKQAGSRTQEPLLASFLSGVLATVVATPCTGPFLGTAVGFAATLPPIWSMMIFTSLGLGMAFPYLVLSAFPALLKWMPRPGPWMETFKQLMGFLMVATVLWLLWVFAGQTDTLALFILLLGFFVLSIGAWIYGRWGSPVKSKRSRLVSYVLVLICVALAGQMMVTASSLTAADPQASHQTGGGWETFSSERLQELRLKGVPVFIDFTAKWCLICQANHLVLSTNEVEQKMEQLGVVRMKADWTRNDPEITTVLRKFGRNGVPLYLLYGTDPESAPEVLPQLLTPEVVKSYLEKM